MISHQAFPCTPLVEKIERPKCVVELEVLVAESGDPCHASLLKKPQ